jgi:hypothetical protein
MAQGPKAFAEVWFGKQEAYPGANDGFVNRIVHGHPSVGTRPNSCKKAIGFRRDGALLKSIPNTLINDHFMLRKANKLHLDFGRKENILATSRQECRHWLEAGQLKGYFDVSQGRLL